MSEYNKDDSTVTMMMCIYCCSQRADELNKTKVSKLRSKYQHLIIKWSVMDMDKEIDQESEVEESSSSVSLSQGTHKSIFDLPTEIITHIVSFLSLQGKNMKSR